MRNKIFYKLLFAIGTGSAAAIAFFSYIILGTEQQQLLSQVEHSMHQLSETVKSSTKHDMLAKDRARVHLVIDTIAKQHDIEKVRIFNKEGQIIFSSDKPEMNRMVDKNGEACYACHSSAGPLERLTIPQRSRIFAAKDGGRSIGMITAIYNEPACSDSQCHAHDESQKVLGVLDITMSLHELDQQMSNNRSRMMLYATSIVLLMSVMLWALVKLLIGEPVSKLVEATNVVASGDLTYKIEVDTHDELGNLARSFNEMTQKLESAKEQIYRQDKLASLGRLCAGVAHELNNPLTGVLTYASFLLKRITGGDEAKADLEVIVRETKRCRQIIKSLLDFSRQSAGKKQRIAVNDVLNRTFEILENQLSLTNVTLELDLNAALPEVWADPSQLQQVFVNIAVNAIDSMDPAGGILRVQSSPADLNGRQSVGVRISDSGCGIPPENLGKIFEPFYTTKGQKGTGLGLSVVWGIIERHEGKITVESEVGKGTTFIITLPVDSTPAKGESVIVGKS